MLQRTHGLGVVPELERQVVRHAWVTPQEFIDGYALSQLTPGPSMLVAVFVGYRAHGLVLVRRIRLDGWDRWPSPL